MHRSGPTQEAQSVGSAVSAVPWQMVVCSALRSTYRIVRHLGSTIRIRDEYIVNRSVHVPGHDERR